MIPNDLLTRLANALRLDAARLLTAEPASTSLPLPWAVGEKVSAIVEANMVGGRTLTRVGDLPLNLKLPFPVKPGDRLNLTLIAKQPSAVFAFESWAKNAASQEQPVQVSRAAQLIEQLAPRGRQAIPQGALSQRTQIATDELAQRARLIVVAPPLLTEPTRDVAKIAQALKLSVAESGLFYESHQAQWVQGERPQDTLLREPQGKLPPIRDPLAMARTPASDASSDARALVPAATKLIADMAPVKLPTDLIHPDSVPQIQQQLQTLDSHQVIWQGQPWPGLAMEWRIDDPPQRESGEPEDLTWNTRLNLSFPHLGGVQAQLALSGNQIRVRLSVEDAATRQNLLNDVNQFLHSLSNAGLVLGQIAIDVDGQS